MRIEPAGLMDFDWAMDEVAPEWGRLTDARGVIALAPTPIHGRMRVGMATFRDGELTWLDVDFWHRQQGVGTALVAAIPGPLRVTIKTDELDALRFFQRRGFRITGADRPDRMHLSRAG